MPIKKLKAVPVLFLIFSAAFAANGISREKPKHPFDLYDHDMHNAFFESANVACETCHADPDSFADHSKINRMGCHFCHNSPKPLFDGATQDCTVCHQKGLPKPPSHRTNWITKHQVYAKTNPDSCTTCHTNAEFCITCHKARDSVKQTLHGRNFRFFHSIEARANPRKCEACHTVDFCQKCHSGRLRSNL